MASDISGAVSEFLGWDAWHQRHQPFELGWWKENLAQLEDPGFSERWNVVKAWIGWTGGWVLDIGCGPRPPFADRCTVIDPLAHEYRKLVPAKWWDDVLIYAVPAEYRLQIGGFKTVVCWNVIDHLVGWRDVLANMRYYLAEDGVAAIATDFWDPFLGHPGVPRDEFMAELERHFEIIKMAEPSPGGRMLGVLLKPNAGKVT